MLVFLFMFSFPVGCRVEGEEKMSSAFPLVRGDFIKFYARIL